MASPQASTKIAKNRIGYLPTLDGWRSIAIIAVLFDHLTAAWFRGHPVAYSLMRTGPNGVSLFFAVSGFLICSRLLEEEDLCGRISLQGFYIRRVCRILPAALAYLIAIGLLGLAGVLIVTPMEWWSCVLFFRNYLPGDWIKRGWGGYTIHYWSLAVEEHFYLLWPALLAFSGRIRARYAAAGLAVAIAVWRSLDLRHQWSQIPGTLYYSRTDVRLDGLLLGCLAALILAEPAWRAQIERRFTPAVWWAGAGAYILTQAISRTHRYTLLESVLLAALIAGTVLRPHTMVGRILENPASKWLGRLSYSLYLWQQLFLVAGASYPFSLLQRFPADLVLVFGAAWLSYELIERPMIRFGHHLAPPPTPGRDDLNENQRSSAQEREDAPRQAALSE